MCLFRWFVVDCLDTGKSKVLLFFFWRADGPIDGIPFLEIKAADLSGRDVDIFCGGEVVVVRGAEEAESVGEDFEDPFAIEDFIGSFGDCFDNLENDAGFRERGGVLQADAYGGYRALYESGRITEADTRCPMTTNMMRKPFIWSSDGSRFRTDAVGAAERLSKDKGSTLESIRNSPPAFSFPCWHRRRPCR